MRERPFEEVSWWQSVRVPVGLMALASGMAFCGYLLTGPSPETTASAPDAAAGQGRPVERVAVPRPPLPDGMPTGKPVRLGKTFDALTPAEIGYARGLAVRNQASPGRRVDGTPGYEFLSTALVTEDGRRKVSVTSYDYAANVQVLQVVDLEAGTVTERTGRGVQAPPSETEKDHALTLLLASPAAAPIRAAYRTSTGRELTSPAQLDVNAGALLSPPATGDGAACAVDRCITFQGRVRDGVWLSFGNLAVDLTARTVRTLS
ncbi:hypothetical protein Acy02nite_32030 [Actinoplanes cyaneus]|uniref:Uncharacterized protein n=1 Tax=Actinoplanes cyaneus TaxID=52696 RepID=A0A919IH88_9ACTN|nr:hypothetical protein [Actinoplanes cyaneus]MCW2142516.1 hypothetical protein [Actinoplanes cyaneus]GID65322.1 hypothetical protein Acy02nite_32030 [Actinoplanes cyaneus]